MMTASTASGRTPALSNTPAIAAPPSSTAVSGASLPISLPCGVRAAPTMTTSVLEFIFLLGRNALEVWVVVGAMATCCGLAGGRYGYPQAWLECGACFAVQQRGQAA